MRHLLLLFILSIPCYWFSQDYSEYYRKVNDAEKLFTERKDSSCFRVYDEAFSRNVPFLKDPYIAAQIAWYLHDNVRFHHYLAICFRNSMPLSAVDAAPMLRSGLTQSERQEISLLFKKESLVKQPTPVTEQICLVCYQSDSVKMLMGKDPVEINNFLLVENKARRFLRDSLLSKGLFANEHFTAISSADGYRDFHRKYNRPDLYASYGPTPKMEYELRVSCPYNIVLHAHCFFINNREMLFEAVKKGYLHPKEYGILQETSILWYKQDENPEDQCSPPNVETCYNIFGFDPRRPQIFSDTPEDLKIVERNRESIFMQRYDVDLRKKQLERELGFAFFFDFADRQSY